MDDPQPQMHVSESGPQEYLHMDTTLRLHPDATIVDRLSEVNLLYTLIQTRKAKGLQNFTGQNPIELK